MTETIFAQATARGPAGLAVIRLSGPGAIGAANALAGPLPPPRLASLRPLIAPEDGTRLDQALVLVFPAPASFTGEDVVEFQIHGSPAVTRAILGVLGRMEGLRLAEPGEFTRRALLNDRLDLSQVEGLGDLLAAETEAQRRQAVALMDGAMSRLAERCGGLLIDALARVEVTIDFADEELPEGVLAAVAANLAAVEREFADALRGSRISERVREGFEVAIVGPPNAGKSTLLNALAGREAALTSEVAGTTRDVIEVRMDLDGLALTLLDMAGLRAVDERIEALGIDRARERAARADLRVFLVAHEDELTALGVEREDEDILAWAKADLRVAAPGLAVSGLTGAGIDGLLEGISAVLSRRAASAGIVSHARQREALEGAKDAVASAARELQRGQPAVELVGEDLRSALRALDFLIGKVDVEAVLDVVFRSFCLGK